MDMSTSHGSPAMMAEPKPGDRFEVALTGSPGRLALPAVLGPDGFAIEQIEDAEGRPVESTLDWAANLLVVPKLAQVVALPADSLWLEYRAPGCFRLLAEPALSTRANGELVTEKGVPILFDSHAWSVVKEAR